MERCKHVKSQSTTVYFKLGKLRWVSTYAQHVWGIIGHLTAEAGNTVGTDGAPPQYTVMYFARILCGARIYAWRTCGFYQDKKASTLQFRMHCILLMHVYMYVCMGLNSISGLFLPQRRHGSTRVPGHDFLA